MYITQIKNGKVEIRKINGSLVRTIGNGNAIDAKWYNNEIAISTAVKVAQNQLESVHKSTLERQESSHQVEIATLKANNESLQERNEFLQSQISTLQEQIASEREARISIAQAESAKQGVVINTGK